MTPCVGPRPVINRLTVAGAIAIRPRSSAEIGIRLVQHGTAFVKHKRRSFSTFYLAVAGLVVALGAALALVFGLSIVVNVASAMVVVFFFVLWVISLQARDRAWGPAGDQMRRSWKRAWPGRFLSSQCGFRGQGRSDDPHRDGEIRRVEPARMADWDRSHDWVVERTFHHRRRVSIRFAGKNGIGNGIGLTERGGVGTLRREGQRRVSSLLPRGATAR